MINTCDLCHKPYDDFYGRTSTCCGTAHCRECLKAAELRGDYEADGEVTGDPPEMVDKSVWRGCLGCAEVAA